MIHSIFKDDELSALFDKEGYVKIPFLDDRGVDKMLQYAGTVMPFFEKCLYKTCSSTDLSSPQLVDDIDQFVSREIRPYVERIFKDYQPLLGNFLIKKPGADSVIPIHQDWTFVDEDQYYSVSIWCALQDTNHSNGNLQVIPRTHKMSKNIRSSPSFVSGFSKIMPQIEEDLIDIPLKAGEAVIYNHALLHASPPNKSTENRVALIFGATHIEAQLVHYFLPDEFVGQNEVVLNMLKMDKEFFLYHVRGQYPNNSLLIRKESHHFNLLNRSEYAKYHNTRSADSILGKFLNLFNRYEK